MAGFSTLTRRAYRSIVRRGLTGTLVHLAKRPFAQGPPDWSRPDGDAVEDEAFDRKYDVETAGIVRLKTLKVPDPNWVYGIDYEPVSAGLFRRAMADLDVAFASFTFVDLGSGKGKALLLAAAHPFKAVIGVEIAPDLHAAAERNIRRYTGPTRAASVTTVCMDAASFDFPDGPLVVHAYNPFDEEVMVRVVGNILARQCSTASPVYVVLCYPRLQHLFGPPRFELVASGDEYAVFIGNGRPGC